MPSISRPRFLYHGARACQEGLSWTWTVMIFQMRNRLAEEEPRLGKSFQLTSTSQSRLVSGPLRRSRGKSGTRRASRELLGKCALCSESFDLEIALAIALVHAQAQPLTDCKTPPASPPTDGNVATKYGSGGSWGRRHQLSRWAPVLVVGSCAPAQLLSGCLGIRKERKKNQTKRASWHGRHTSAFWQLCSALHKPLSESPGVACALVDGTWRAPHAHAGCQHASNSSPEARGPPMLHGEDACSWWRAAAQGIHTPQQMRESLMTAVTTAQHCPISSLECAKRPSLHLMPANCHD